MDEAQMKKRTKEFAKEIIKLCRKSKIQNPKSAMRNRKGGGKW